MTGLNGNMNKMFRWLKDRKKVKGDKKPTTVEDDYGFRKKHIILQETENGHSVIIRDNGTTLVYPQSFCKLNYRARMPTPIQTYKETSSHIYDEIPELPARKRLDMDAHAQGVDILKHTQNKPENGQVDFRNAIEVGPYLIVPIVNSTNSRDVEIFKRNDISQESGQKQDKHIDCQCECVTMCKCFETPDLCSQRIGKSVHNDDTDKHDTHMLKDAKVVLTRCVKSKSDFTANDSLNDVSESSNRATDLCSFNNGAFVSNANPRSQLESTDSDSNSRTLTGTPETSVTTPDTLSERPDSCAISEGIDAVVLNSVEIVNAVDVSNVIEHGVNCAEKCDYMDRCCDYDLSTSGESDVSTGNDYDLYLSKIEDNLKLKHDVRNMIRNIESTIPERDEDDVTNNEDIETMTYVSSLSEYSSATSHVSDISADKSSSDDSSGYYECTDEIPGLRERKRESRVNLERSVSAPVSSPTHVKKVFKINHKLTKDKSKSKKSSQSSRSNSFDCNFYKALSDEDKEMYLFPSGKQSDSSVSSGSRHSRSKPVLTPQPTPVYMEPYRGKSRSHNRLLGDLIRMNYDKQLFIH